MARIDMATFGDRKRKKSIYKLKHGNVSNSVGAGGVNERNDVLMVQAMFQICGVSDNQARYNFGFKKKQLPRPTGRFDRSTQRAIWAFQRKHSRNLLSVDGQIHPADYENRVMSNDTRRFMTITKMNFAMLETRILYDLSENLILEIKKIAPTIFVSYGVGFIDP